MKPAQLSLPQNCGAQRLTVRELQQWEALKFGLFIHFGMSTYTGSEFPDGRSPSSMYAPQRLDVDQWVSVARDAGMKYAVLTAKHVAGHCLWPSRHTDYHVGTSGNRTDVVEAFVKSCERRGVLPGLYYCSWDNHHRFGSQTPTDSAPYEKSLNLGDPLMAGGVQLSYTTRAYMDFQSAQVEELLTQYGPLAEIWIDVPALLPRFFRHELYQQIAQIQPQAVIVLNNGVGDGSKFSIEKTWPSDIISIERHLPDSNTGHIRWREIEGRQYYMPGEVCDSVGREWFFSESDAPRSDEELLGMYLVSISRRANLLLNVGPDKSGVIPDQYTSALQRLQRSLSQLASPGS